MRVQLLPPQHWRVRLGVRTLASQAGNTGSIPVRATEIAQLVQWIEHVATDHEIGVRILYWVLYE